MESRASLDFAEVAIKLEGARRHRRTNGKCKTLELSKRIRISLPTYQKLITELTQAGMLERLTPKSQPAIFQLYPKPFPKPVQPKPEIREERLAGKPSKPMVSIGMRITGNTGVTGKAAR